MENCQMNRQTVRPYRTTCGMSQSQMTGRTVSDTAKSEQSCRHMPGCASSGKAMYDGIDHMIPAMAYVPYTEFCSTYDLCYALQAGTIFPELCKPFCGKRGVRR